LTIGFSFASFQKTEKKGRRRRVKTKDRAFQWPCNTNATATQVTPIIELGFLINSFDGDATLLTLLPARL